MAALIIMFDTESRWGLYPHAHGLIQVKDERKLVSATRCLRRGTADALRNKSARDHMCDRFATKRRGLLRKAAHPRHPADLALSYSLRGRGWALLCTDDGRGYPNGPPEVGEGEGAKPEGGRKKFMPLAATYTSVPVRLDEAKAST